MTGTSPCRRVLQPPPVEAGKIDLALYIAGWLAGRGDVDSALQTLEEFLAGMLPESRLVPLQAILADHHCTASETPVDAAVFSAFKARGVMKG